jgi:arsenate reductase
MAEGWARHLHGGAIDPYSAGVEPHGLNPRAVEVMKEAGVDISGQTSKRVDDLPDLEFDYVVTVCSHADEHCPAFPRPARVVHVGFPDPAKARGSEEEIRNTFRSTRDEIKAFVETLPNILQTNPQIREL